MACQEYPLYRLLRDYWLFLEGYRFKFIVFTILRMLSSLIPFAIAYCLGRIVDFFTRYKLGQSLNEFYILIIIIALLGCLQVLLRFFAKLRIQKIGADIRKKVRLLAITKLMNLELSWHEKEDTGSKIQKINTGSEMIYDGLHVFSNDGTEILASLIGCIGIFLFLNWKYALFAILYLMLYFLGEYYFSIKLSKWENRLNKMKEMVSGKVHESISNLLTIKSLGLKRAFNKSMTGYERKYYEVWLKTKIISQSKSKSIKIFFALGYAGFILLVGFDAALGLITVGSIFVFVSYFDRLRGALGKISDQLSDFIGIKSGIGRFMTIIDANTFENEDSKLDVSENWRTIEFANVTFRYKNKIVLKDFNLVISRNDKLGIVGRSGCGKSTLVKLLLGLYLPEKGKVLIDDVEVHRYKSRSLTDKVGIALQEPEMFNQSLLANIIISSPKMNPKLLKQAVSIAQLNHLIRKLPQGLKTPIGEKGYKLSGGERQRVGISRAVYKGSQILILDEATSNLDSKTESLIQKGLNNYIENKTLIIIAHRLSTLRNVNHIVVIDNGKIVERGTFLELIKMKGRFYQLYKLQRTK